MYGHATVGICRRWVRKGSAGQSGPFSGRWSAKLRPRPQGHFDRQSQCTFILVIHRSRAPWCWASWAKNYCRTIVFGATPHPSCWWTPPHPEAPVSDGVCHPSHPSPCPCGVASSAVVGLLLLATKPLWTHKSTSSSSVKMKSNKLKPHQCPFCGENLILSDSVQWNGPWSSVRLVFVRKWVQIQRYGYRTVIGKPFLCWAADT